MQKLKIAVWHNLGSGGAKRALFDHVKGLCSQGHHVESWCPPTADQAYLPLSTLIDEHIVAIPPVPTRRIRRRFSFDSLYRTERLEQMYAIMAHCQQCGTEINQGGFDVLLANPCRFFYNTPIGRYVDAARVMYLPEPFRPLYEALPRLPWVATSSRVCDLIHPLSFLRCIRAHVRDLASVHALRIQAREELANAKAFDTILVNSLFSRESVLRSYGIESSVCYLGIDETLFRSVERPREPFVVGLGGIAQNKRIDRALHGIAAIPEADRPKLIWIGNFARPDYLRQMQELALQVGVVAEFRVGIPDSELVDLLSRATVMVYTPFLEPFGLAPLEANACGTPVVAIAEGGVRETIQHGVNGLLIPGDEPAQIGQAIATLLNDKRLARDMGDAARRNVTANWGMDDAIKRLECFLIKAADTHKALQPLPPPARLAGRVA